MRAWEGGSPLTCAMCDRNSDELDRVRQAIVLRHVAKPPAYLDGVVRLPAHDLGGAGRRLEQPKEELDSRALARAVGPQKPGDALLHLEIHGVKGNCGAVALGEILGFQDKRHEQEYIESVVVLEGELSACALKCVCPRSSMHRAH